MNAATHTRYGAPNVLTLIQLSAPEPGPGEVLIRVCAAPVTQGDRRMRAADFPGISWLAGRLFAGFFRPRNPTPGTVFAGEVVAVGYGVMRFKAGDRVFGTCMHSAHAELLCLRADGPLALSPNGLSHLEAASIPYGATTALHFLRDLGKVRRGQRVLIIGAAGEVGRSAVQLAHHLGAHVTAVTGPDCGHLRHLGADEVIDFTVEDYTERSDFDIILDTADALSFGRCRKMLTPKGRYLSLHLSLKVLVQMLATAMLRGRRAVFGVSFATAEDMQTVANLAACGALRPVIERTYALSAVVEAHERIEHRPRGSIIIEMLDGEARWRSLRAGLAMSVGRVLA